MSQTNTSQTGSGVAVDARGLSCPEPVVMLKKAVDSLGSANSLTVLVDSAVAAENCTRFATHAGFKVETKGESSGDITLILTR